MSRSPGVRFVLAIALPLVVPAVASEFTPRPIVVAELFTSEGCSSCPPADRLLRTLESEQPFAGVEILAIEEHVDYWDRLGWRDPFSSSQFTTRQSEYNARVFRSSEIYTPQLVVDGARECVGSDPRAASAIVASSARQVRADVRVTSFVDAGRISATVRVALPPGLERRGTADVIVVVAEQGLVSAVQRGENRGRTLVHGNVARSLTAVGELLPGDQLFTGTVDVPISANWKPAHLRLVGFIQERDSRRILGAGTTEPLSQTGRTQ